MREVDPKVVGEELLWEDDRVEFSDEVARTIIESIAVLLLQVLEDERSEEGDDDLVE